MMEQASAFAASNRETIPDEVKVFVWNRDAGRCVRCGGNQRLEFDHVIPVALGGANTARNLQLLCETCNRAKGASIA
jgi:5-methylcytosine-specific restriction endonuclease McrA